MKEWRSFDEIVRAEGMFLIDKNGRRLLDGVASMWCNVWGHSRQELISAMHAQARKLQHSPMFNLTNEPAEILAEKLVKMSPGMHRVFFSDNGSTAVEIAIKIALQYWTNTGVKNKKKIASLKNGYHGDTFGAMSVGYIPEFFSGFGPYLFPTVRFDAPDRYMQPVGAATARHLDECLEGMEKKLAADDSVAALIMESGAQVAGGVAIYPEGFQRRVSKICKKYGVLLVLDEIATGFGRLGSMAEYAAQKSSPDIVAYGKMLTGGYLTMSATLATKKIYDSFLGEFHDYRHLFHGHTYTGNPIAAAVANENLELYERTGLIRGIKKSSGIFERYLDEISGLELVGDVRHKGMLMGIELVRDRKKMTPISPRESVNKTVFEAGKRHGIYLRTLGNILMLVPPLAMPETHLKDLIEGAIKTINQVRDEL